MAGATTEVAESHLRMEVVVLGGQARPLEEQVEGEGGVGEVEGLPGERTWVELKGVLTLVAVSCPSAPLHRYITSHHFTQEPFGVGGL